MPNIWVLHKFLYTSNEHHKNSHTPHKLTHGKAWLKKERRKERDRDTERRTERDRQRETKTERDREQERGTEKQRDRGHINSLQTHVRIPLQLPEYLDNPLENARKGRRVLCRPLHVGKEICHEMAKPLVQEHVFTASLGSQAQELIGN